MDTCEFGRICGELREVDITLTKTYEQADANINDFYCNYPDINNHKYG